MIQTVILGNGNLGTHLCQAFEKSKHINLLQNYNRKGKLIHNCTVPVTSNISKIAMAEVYILAFNDSALYELSAFKNLDGLVVHTSGATSLEVLNSFANYGVFYPVQSFKANVPVIFTEVPIAIEANSAVSEKILVHLARAISNKVSVINSSQRKALHLAAVFANNFSNFMYTQALDICIKNNINFDVIKPLISATITKLENTTPDKLQTGPAIRNDKKTINEHLILLENEAQNKLYHQLTKAIQDYYGKEL